MDAPVTTESQGAGTRELERDSGDEPARERELRTGERSVVLQVAYLRRREREAYASWLAARAPGDGAA